MCEFLLKFSNEYSSGLTLSKQQAVRHTVLSIGYVQAFSLAGTRLLHDKPDNISDSRMTCMINPRWHENEEKNIKIFLQFTFTTNVKEMREKTSQ